MNIMIGYDFNNVEKVIRNKGKRLRKFINDYTLFDIETTDLNINYAEIIEIAAIKVRKNNIIDSFETLVKPQESIPIEISKLTGITDEMVLNAPAISEVLPHFIDFIGDDILVGHNINSYDLNIVYDIAVDLLDFKISNDFIDTLDLSRCLVGLDLPHYNLTSLCNYFNVINKKAHSALSDVMANHEVYQKMKSFEIGNYKFSNSEQRIYLPFKCSVDVTGKRICLTGEFECGSRDYVKQSLTELGARVTNSISKKTNYLLVGDLGTTTTHKIDDALLLSVDVVYEKDFIITGALENV